MNRENFNSDVLILTLIRPADSLRISFTAIGQRQGCEIVHCSSIYDILIRLGQTPRHRVVCLIVRPVLLPVYLAAYLPQHFDNLRMIGWLDVHEPLSDKTLHPDVLRSMVLVSHLNQLEHAVHMFSARVSDLLEDDTATFPQKFTSEQLKYDLSDEEIDALLGVNQ